MIDMFTFTILGIYNQYNVDPKSGLSRDQAGELENLILDFYKKL